MPAVLAPTAPQSLAVLDRPPVGQLAARLRAMGHEGHGGRAVATINLANFAEHLLMWALGPLRPQEVQQAQKNQVMSRCACSSLGTATQYAIVIIRRRRRRG
jgi:hypothetical protein